MANVLDMLSFLNELQIINDIIDHSENIIFAKDLDGKYTIANQACVKYFGKTKEEVLGKHDEDIFSPEEAQFNREKDRLVFDTGKRISYEKLKHDDVGQEVYFYLTKNIVKDKLGRTVGLSATVVDITEYKKEQQELATEREYRRSLEVANKVRSNFLKNLSHNLRTPLMGIIGATVLDMDSDSDWIHKKDVEIFKYSAELLVNIVDEIIDFEPIINQNFKLKMKPFKMIALIRFFQEYFSFVAKEKGVVFKYSYDKVSTEMILLGDFQRIVQIINKLFSMYLRLVPMNKTIKVEFATNNVGENGHVLLNCKLRSDAVIPESIRERMFSEYDTDDEKNVIEHASSLGLETFIAKRVAAAFKGDVSYEINEDGFGMFDVVIPLQKTEESEILSTNLSNLHVLIADDNKINQAVLKRIVQKLGIKNLHVVGNGQEAYDSYIEMHQKGSPYTMILMDLQMPILNGMEATQRIRDYENSHKLDKVKVVAVTAFVTSEDRDDCYRVGMDGFLGKPVTQSMLAESIIDLAVRQ